MLKTRNILFIFIPALCLALITLFIRIVQYAPLVPKIDDAEQAGKQDTLVIPIFENDPIIGNKKSPTTIIAFEDFGCPSCRQQDGFLLELMTAYPEKIKIIWKSLPVTRFPYSSELAARYAYCAHKENKFEEFKKFAFANGENLSETTLALIGESIKLNKDKLTQCLSGSEVTEYVEKNIHIGRILAIQSVPTFFIDNKQIGTPESVDQWKTILNLQ